MYLQGTVTVLGRLAWLFCTVSTTLQSRLLLRKDWLLDQLVKLLPAWALQPEDLNTDGIDPQGRDFHIHDCSINNDDDSIAVKPLSRSGTFSDCTRNLLIENMTLTGFGASIGSIPPHADVNCVRNVTFRNISVRPQFRRQCNQPLPQ